MSEPGNRRNPVDQWVQWAREALTILAAAGAAYMGIRVDLARNQADIEYIKVQQARIEAQVDKMRETNYSVILGQGGKK